MSVAEGRAARDEGISRVTASTSAGWKIAYVGIVADWFASLPRGATFTGETLRLIVKKNGMADPPHPNAWGGVANGVLRRLLSKGLVQVVGFQNATDPRAHARLYRLYQKR